MERSWHHTRSSHLEEGHESAIKRDVPYRSPNESTMQVIDVVQDGHGRVAVGRGNLLDGVGELDPLPMPVE